MSDTQSDPNTEAVEKYQERENQALRRDHFPDPPGLNQQFEQEGLEQPSQDALDEAENNREYSPATLEENESFRAEQLGQDQRDADDDTKSRRKRQ